MATSQCITSALLLALTIPTSPIAASTPVNDVYAGVMLATPKISSPEAKSPMIGYSEEWFVLWLQKLSYSRQHKEAMQIGSLGLRSHPESARIRIAVAAAAYAADRCD